jgi:Tfp pilus assembly protein PilF
MTLPGLRLLHEQPDAPDALEWAVIGFLGLCCLGIAAVVTTVDLDPLDQSVVAVAAAILFLICSRRPGRLAGAETQYRAALARQPSNADALVGLAQILNRQGRSTEAEALLDRAQSAGNSRAVERLRGDGLRQQAAGTADPVAREALLRAASAANPSDPWTRLDLARALGAGGKKAEARLVMAEATGSANPSTDALRAGAMFAAEDGRPADAVAFVGRLPPAARTPDMRALLAQAGLQNDIRNAIGLGAISRSAAHEKLRALAAQPDPDGVRGVAIARAFLQMHDPAGVREALATAQAATRTPTPSQRIAYAGILLQAGDERGTKMLIQARDRTLGAALVREGITTAPDDPQVWLMSAMLNRARGNLQRAYDDLKRAQALRRQEIGVEQPETFDGPGATRTRRSNAGDNAVTDGDNPFRRGQMPATSTAEVTVFTSSVISPVDPMLQDIDQQIGTVREDLGPQITLSPSYRSRTGSPGLDQLNEVSVPTELIAWPLGQGVLTATGTPVFLSAGPLHTDATSLASFGTGITPGSPTPSQHAQGIGLSAAYQFGWLKTDVGTSPVGFQQQNILGRVEIAPAVSDNAHLRMLVERRAVTDSVLSYAGTKDPATGIAWGGVTRTRAHAQLEFSARDANFYVGGGYAVLDGKNVESNREYEFGARGTNPIWRNTTDELRLGVDVVYFGYDQNLRFFTLGQGGYFSPQSYLATLFPLRYTSKHDDINWSVGGSAGYQTYNEKSSPVFPNNPGYQSALVSSALTSPTPILTAYPSRSASGIVEGASGSFEYQASDTIALGGEASYQHAGDWSETIGRLYVHYIFDGGSW